MSLKLREMWNECEKMEPELLRVFVDGLLEMVESRHNTSLTRREEPIRACVAQDRSVRGYLEWTPAEDDLLHRILSESKTNAAGYRSFARHPGNVNERPEGGARQRHVKLESDAAKKGGRWL